MIVEKHASYPSLVDRTVFVTGGADSVGSTAVRNFARQGSKIAFVDINAEYARATVERCVEDGALSHVTGASWLRCNHVQ